MEGSRSNGEREYVDNGNPVVGMAKEGDEEGGMPSPWRHAWCHANTGEVGAVGVGGASAGNGARGGA